MGLELLLMDQNEKATNPSLYISMITTFGSDKLRIVNLDWGDYAIPLETGLLLIERKTVNDLLGSIADGRIFRQVEGMCETSTFVFIIVYGSLLYDKDDLVVVDGRHTKWKGASVRAALLSLQLAGAVIAYVPANRFLKCMQEIIHLVSKPDHLHSGKKRIITFRDITMTDTQRQAYKGVEFISSLPGIGRKKAEALMSHVASKGTKWGTVIDALVLISHLGNSKPTPPALSEHWGTLTAKRIKEFLGLKHDEYLTRIHQTPVLKKKAPPTKKGTKRK